MDRTCSTLREMRNPYSILVGKCEGKNYLGDEDIERKIIKMEHNGSRIIVRRLLSSGSG
jgi:hypothetical protein